MISKKCMFFGFILFLLFFLGLTQYIADSEFWPITLAHEFGKFPNPNTSLYYKFLFHGLLKIPYYFHLSNVEHILLVKSFMALIGVGIIILFYRICFKIYASTNIAICCTLLLLSTQAFFSQYSRVRSDILVCFLVLLSFWHILRVSERKKLTFWGIFIQAFLSLVAFLITPKAVYWIILNGIFLYFHLDFLNLNRRRVLISSCAFLFPFSLIVLSGIWMQGSVISDFNTSWISAVSYFKQSSLSSFVAIERLITFDAFASVIALVSIFYSGWPLLKNRPSNVHQKSLFWTAIIGLFFLLAHNQRVPFFIASLLPFIFLPVGLWLQNRTFMKNPQKSMIAVLFIVFLGSKIYSFKTPFLYWHSNHEQLEKIAELEKAISTVPNTFLFDGMGILPRFRNIYFYIEPFAQMTPQEVVNMIQLNHPDVVLWNDRSFYLYPFLMRYLEDEFQENGPGFWTRKGKTYPKITSRMPLKYYFLFEPY